MRTRATVRLPFILLLVAVLHSTFPILPASASPVSVPMQASSVPAQAIGKSQDPPPVPDVPTYQPPSYPALPGLALEVETTPESVSVGDTITVRLTVTNRAEYPAEDLVLTLPLPPGVRAEKAATQATFTVTPLQQPVSEIATPLEFKAPVLDEPAPSDQARSAKDDQLSPRLATPASAEIVPPALPADTGVRLASVPTDPGVTSDQVAKLPIAVAPAVDRGRDLQWNLPKLDGASVAVLEVTLVLNAPQPDGAVVFEPWVIARDLVEPARASGGTLVIDAAHKPVTSRVEPGSRSSVRSADGRVTVEFPSQAADRALSIRYARLADDADDLRARGVPLPEHGLLGRASLDAFTLTATDDAGRDLHQFKEPLSLSVSYTEAQLRARGLREGDLTLAWFDESEKRWQPVPTTIDPKAHTATATIDHFSVWTLSDGSSPSAAFVPSLQGFQVSSFTGAASYQVPMEVPAGPAGIKPNLGLSYSSAASDGTGGMRERWQSSWVGKGWTLDAGGSVARVRSPVGEFWDNFTFSMGGRSYDIVRGEQFTGTTGDLNPTLWTWVAVDEADFLKVRAVDAGGGVIVWVAWTKDGSRYDFTKPLYTTDTDTKYIYQWLLMRVTDTHGNRIDYQYSVDDATAPSDVNIYQPTYYLSQISWGYDGGMGTDVWGHPVVLGTARYRVLFQASSRWASPTASVDTLWEYPTGKQTVVPHEAYRLNSVVVQSWGPAAGSYETIRSYALEYYDSTQSVWADSSAGQRVLTLKRVARVGRDGGQLPWTTFTYRMDSGAWPYNPGWNRLVTVNNGQGGQIQVTYGKSFGSSTLNEEANYHRVAELLRQDVSGQSYSRSTVTTYEYPTAALNSKQYSLKVWYAEFPPGGYGNSKSILAHAEQREFRGHAWVRAQDYDGATIGSPRLRKTETFFYQGSAGCTPTVTGGVIDSSTACYADMARQELWKGQPYLVKTYDGNGSLLRQTETIYNYEILPFFGLYDYTGSVGYPRTGLWRQFTPTRVTREGFNEGAATLTLGKTTAYCYQTNYQTGTQYGNLTHTLEYSQLVTIDPATQLTDCDYPTTSVAPVRITRTDYATMNTSSIYLADRPAQRAMFGASASALLGLTEYFYDGSLVSKSLTDRGRLTLERAYRNLTGATLYSRDTGYDYDVWGNRTVEATYADWGARSYPSYSAPGSSSAARTTTIVYDATFHAFPIRQTNALGHIERADYDYRMGTLTKIGGPNVANDTTFTNFTCATANVQMEITCASYDQFGRILTIVKPGDTLASPTQSMVFADAEIPFRYFVREREVTGSALLSNIRYTQKFYDGLGREIQTKVESQDVAQNIIVDRRYDGLGRVIQESQPRYVNEVTPAYSQYTSPGASLYRPTTTTYDALGRVGTITAPDSTTTSHAYWLGSAGPVTAVYDAKNHLTAQETDALGRLVKVYEYRGNNGSEGAYVVDATTTYWYDALDQLVNVVDQLNNTTTLYYDALGRKITQNDPDMGIWNYYYDVNGNLVTHVDARGVAVNFGYDSLNRLTNQWYSTSEPGRLFNYDQTSATNGKGRRTSTCTILGSGCAIYQAWNYDGRGRTTYAGQNASGVVQELTMGYDSADRLTSQTYGTGGEIVTTSYDAAWRPTSLCTSLGGCYVTNATYSALAQPEIQTYGNTTKQQWLYANTMARLDGLQIGTTASPTAYFNASYTYDAVGNMQTLSNAGWGTQNFAYDHRDRMTNAHGTLYYEDYTYNEIGNLTSKFGVVYGYGSNGNGTGAGPHQARSVGGQAYSYDANGNLTSGGGRTYVWNAENKPASVTSGGVTETYEYDADGNRIMRTRSGVTTIYALGAWERVGTNAKKLYTFNGRVVAQRDGVTNAVTWIHPEHLGGSLITTNSTGVVSESAWYTPWGKVGGGGFTQTSINYTGQRLDDTGLLYYNARYYDPGIGRFVSADSVVPGNASGGLDGVALKPLTVSFSEPGFASKLAQENQFGPWFTLSSEQRQQLGSPMGSANPQSLNRYSYVQNNPLKYTDPSGHYRTTVRPSDKDVFNSILDRNKSIALAKVTSVFEVGGIILGTAAGGLVTGSVPGAIAGGLVGGAVAISAPIIANDAFDQFSKGFELANKAAGEDGTINISIDTLKGQVFIEGIGKDGAYYAMWIETRNAPFQEAIIKTIKEYEVTRSNLERIGR